MGKKKKKTYMVWCFYCEREFEDEKVLIQHQKAKHFKCHVCHKKLSSAGGMVIHVLQVHKESISKVPNAKPERESLTDLEIYGMEGIPPEILAAHDGDDVDDERNPAKVARVEVPPSLPFVGGVVMRTNGLGMPPQPFYAPMPPVHTTPGSMTHRPPPTWSPQVPPPPQGWRMGTTVAGQPGLGPPRPLQPPQPLFPIQGQGSPAHPATSTKPPSQQLFAIGPPLPSGPGSIPQSAPSQPLFPLQPSGPPPLHVVGSQGTKPQQFHGLSEYQKNSTGVPPPLPPANIPGPPPPPVPSIAASAQPPPPPGSHMYASGPNTGGPAIGPPPVISNKPPGPATSTNEVYLVWDDEMMSMEERRMSLSQYQALDETMQMNSVNAAIDRRILESKLAGRMGFNT